MIPLENILIIVKKLIKIVNTLEKIMKRTGIKTVFDDTIVNEKGQYVDGLTATIEENGIKQNIIKINPKSTKALEFVIVHELTHNIGSKEFNDKIINYCREIPKLNEKLDYIIKYYTDIKGGENNATNYVNEEVIADVVGHILGNTEFLDKLAGTDESKGIFKTVLDFIKNRTDKENQFYQEIEKDFIELYNKGEIRDFNETK